MTVKETFPIKCAGQATKKKLGGGSSAQTGLHPGQFNKAQIRTIYSTEESQQAEDLQVHMHYFFDR